MIDQRELIDHILEGDATTILQDFPEQSIDCVITSPPYFNQRDYGHSLQMGLEKTVPEYIARLVQVFDQVYRVLKNSGTIWLNLGDKYEEGQLLGIPWRIALALQERGWLLRSDIIWHKVNAMPQSVSNRPTSDHEYLFFLLKPKSITMTRMPLENLM